MCSLKTFVEERRKFIPESSSKSNNSRIDLLLNWDKVWEEQIQFQGYIVGMGSRAKKCTHGKESNDAVSLDFFSMFDFN